jgi:hypothetical protein
MRLTINLERDLYAVARSLAQADDSTISQAVNKLLRRALDPAPPPPRAASGRKKGDDHLLPTVRGERPITSEDVYRIDEP